jgi:hypothetical protein
MANNIEKYTDDELVLELSDRLSTAVNEEMYEMLFEKGIVKETDDECIDIMNRLLEKFYGKTITKQWK